MPLPKVGNDLVLAVAVEIAGRQPLRDGRAHSDERPGIVHEHIEPKPGEVADDVVLTVAVEIARDDAEQPPRLELHPLSGIVTDPGAVREDGDEVVLAVAVEVAGREPLRNCRAEPDHRPGIVHEGIDAKPGEITDHVVLAVPVEIARDEMEQLPLLKS